MNEVNKVHLGRTVFTIAVDAHKHLQDYLAGVKKHAGGQEVIDEVEARMAELLIEDRGITKDKVVLDEDINYIETQLGTPADFKDSEADEPARSNAGEAPRRLMRDNNGAILAGVCSGLGRYFDTDPLWFRLIFVALSFGGGFGLFLYVVLWVIMPEAKTEADRLQMAGKQVTLESLKQRITEADIENKANQATRKVANIANRIFVVLGKVIGLTLIITAVATTIAALIAGIYFSVEKLQINGQFIFPIGTRESVLLIAGVLTVLLASALAISVGQTLLRSAKKFAVRTNLVLVAMLILAFSALAGLLAVTVPQIDKRLDKTFVIEHRDLPDFSSVDLLEGRAEVRYYASDKNAVEIKTAPWFDTSEVETVVENGSLKIKSKVDFKDDCEGYCKYVVPEVNVYSRAN